MKPRRQIRDEFEQEVIKLHWKGGSLREIAKKVGKSKTCIHKIVVKRLGDQRLNKR